ncbi:MAG: hypothetical protein AAB729_02840 [Patescibacteria group bacterium]
MDTQNTQDNLITPPLYAFLDSCLFDKGIKDIPESLKEQMIKDLADRLQQWLMQSIFQHLPESAVPEMEKLLATAPSQDEIMAFVGTQIPNISEIFKDEMVKFKQAYLG